MSRRRGFMGGCSLGNPAFLRYAMSCEREYERQQRARARAVERALEKEERARIRELKREEKAETKKYMDTLKSLDNFKTDYPLNLIADMEKKLDIEIDSSKKWELFCLIQSSRVWELVKKITRETSYLSFEIEKGKPIQDAAEQLNITLNTEQKEELQKKLNTLIKRRAK